MSPVSHRSLVAVMVVAAVLTTALALPLQAAVFQSPPPTAPTGQSAEPPAAKPLKQPPVAKPSQPQAAPPAKFGPALCSGWFYTIRRGDTLNRIAARYDVSVNDLMRCNGLTTTKIYAGRSLLIPGQQPPAEPQLAPTSKPASGCCSCYYTVQHGDTLNSIAERYGTTTWTLQSINYIPNRNVVYAGQVLRVPCGVVPEPQTAAQPGPEPGPSPVEETTRSWYQVRAGDTVTKIANRFEVSNSAIIEANDLKEPYTIYTGQWLRIP